MTKEEAIQILKRTKDNSYCECDIGVALDMAIESLQKDIERHEMVIRASERYLGVVRCKDCKHYTDAGTIPNKSCCGFCTKLGAVSYYGVDANDYCSFGERRE